MIIKDTIEELKQLKETIQDYIKDNTCIEHSYLNSDFKQEKELIEDLNKTIDKYEKWKKLTE